MLRRVIGLPIISASILAPLLAWAPPAGAASLDSDAIQFHGYGEVHYNNPEIGTMSSGTPSQVDFHRFVLGWGYEFAPNLRVDAEVDFEHAATEIELEYAQIDYDLSPTLTLRAGSLLMPVGPLNEFHEPPTFYSVERPYVQRYVIPTTWQENGVGLVGQAAQGSLSYRAYVTAGLDATRITAVEGLHDVSSKGAESTADDLAGVARAEYAAGGGLMLGASGYYGGADQRQPGLGDVSVGMYEADARWRGVGFDLRGVFARVQLSGADSVSAVAGETVGSAMQGWYLEAAYDLLGRGLGSESRRALYLFVRHEDFDTNRETPEGFAKNPAADRRVLTVGASYLPIEKVAFKADFEHWEDGADDTLNRVNLGAGFMF